MRVSKLKARCRNVNSNQSIGNEITCIAQRAMERIMLGVQLSDEITNDPKDVDVIEWIASFKWEPHNQNNR